LAELLKLKEDDYSFHHPEIPANRRWLYEACAHCEHDIWNATIRRKDLNRKSKIRKIKFFKAGKEQAINARKEKVAAQQAKPTKGIRIAPPGSSLIVEEAQITSAVGRMMSFFSGRR
jgi:hypothetical protein